MTKILGIIILLTAAIFNISTAHADVVAQASSIEGHRLRLTTDRCTQFSGRARQLQWGRAYAWLPNGESWTGCSRLDYDTVIVEWDTVNGIVERRYQIDDFTWAPGFGNRGKN